MKKTLIVLLTLTLTVLVGIFFILVADRRDRQSERAEQIAKQQALSIAIAETEKERKSVQDERDKQELLKKLDNYERAGAMTNEQAQESRDILMGKIKLYKRPDGTFTTNAFE